MFSTKSERPYTSEVATTLGQERLVAKTRKNLAKSLWMLATLLVVLTITACGGIPEIPGNKPPVISDFKVTKTDFRTGLVTANVSDPDGSLTTVKVDWGDGSTTDDTSGATAMGASHKYAKPQSYTVTLTIIDDEGASTTESKSLEITYPAERCVGIKGIQFCAQFSGDFKHVRVYAQLLGEEVTFFKLEDGKAATEAWIPPGVARVLGKFNASTKTITLQFQTCTIPFIKGTCRTVATDTIRF